MKKIWIAAVLALVLTFSVAFATQADFGDFSSDSDFGYDDSFDSYDYDTDYDTDYDSDYSGNYVYYNDDGSTSSSSRNNGSLIPVIVFILIIAFIIYRSSKNASTNGTQPTVTMTPKYVRGAGAKATDASTLKRIDDYLALDPSFSKSAFEEKIANMYVKFQESWQKKDMDDLRPYLTDNMFAQCDRQLDNYRQNHQTNHIERINVTESSIVGWTQEENQDVMICRLKTRIVDYTTDDNTGNIIRGSNVQERFMEYEWKLVRSTGVKTSDSSGTTVQKCPNCGAPIDVNRTAKCEYCGAILTTDSYDWVLSSIKGISQRTAR